MSVWVIIRNLGTVIQFFKISSSLFGSFVSTKKMPPKEMFISLLDQAQELLDKKVIDLPGSQEEDISAALKQLEEIIRDGVKSS